MAERPIGSVRLRSVPRRGLRRPGGGPSGPGGPSLASTTLEFPKRWAVRHLTDRRPGSSACCRFSSTTRCAVRVGDRQPQVRHTIGDPVPFGRGPVTWGGHPPRPPHRRGRSDPLRGRPPRAGRRQTGLGGHAAATLPCLLPVPRQPQSRLPTLEPTTLVRTHRRRSVARRRLPCVGDHPVRHDPDLAGSRHRRQLQPLRGRPRGLWHRDRDRPAPRALQGPDVTQCA